MNINEKTIVKKRISFERKFTLKLLEEGKTLTKTSKGYNSVTPAYFVKNTGKYVPKKELVYFKKLSESCHETKERKEIEDKVQSIFDKNKLKFNGLFYQVKNLIKSFNNYEHFLSILHKRNKTITKKEYNTLINLFNKYETYSHKYHFKPSGYLVRKHKKNLKENVTND